MVGGEKLTVATNAVFSKLIADTLAIKYSWQGRKGKKAFTELQASKLIISIVSVITINIYLLFDSEMQRYYKGNVNKHVLFFLLL